MSTKRIHSLRLQKRAHPQIKLKRLQKVLMYQKVSIIILMIIAIITTIIIIMVIAIITTTTIVIIIMIIIIIIIIIIVIISCETPFFVKDPFCALHSVYINNECLNC